MMVHGTNKVVLGHFYPVLVQKALAYLGDSLALIKSVNLQNVCRYVLSHPAFSSIPGSLSYHNVYVGGNMVHTANLISTALQFRHNLLYNDINWDILLTAAYWHDFGKVLEYNCIARDKLSMTYERSNSECFLGLHPITGYAEFWAVTAQLNIPFEQRKAIAHCILASHARLEWGSPVTPQSREAWLLHLSDMMTAYCTNEKEIGNIQVKKD